MSVELSVSEIGQQIYFVRNNRIMIDSDLALLYEIETFNLNKAVKRNQEHFPEDFMYQLTRQLAAMTSTIQQLMPLAESKAAPVPPASVSMNYENSLYRRGSNSTVEVILETVAEYYQISVASLKASTRIAAIANPRQICIYLIRKYSGLSYKSIGAIFGGKDHTTILHAFRKVEVEMSRGTDIYEALNSIQIILEAKGIKLGAVPGLTM